MMKILIPFLLLIVFKASGQIQILRSTPKNSSGGGSTLIIGNPTGAPSPVIHVNNINILNSSVDPISSNSQPPSSTSVGSGMTYYHVTEVSNSDVIKAKLRSDLTNDAITTSLVKCQIIVQIPYTLSKKAIQAECLLLPNKYLCAVGKAMDAPILQTVAVGGLVSACSWTIRKVTPEIINVSMSISDSVTENLNALRYWFQFFNTIEGARWLMYKLNGGM